MELLNLLPKKLIFFIAPVSFFLLASCGSYQYSGYEDGIYGETNRGYESQNENATQDSNSSYYKNLFAEEAALYGEVLSESTIFTDADSYTSTGNYEADGQQSNYAGGQAPWGNDPDTYTVNIYNHGFYGGFYNPYWGGGLYAFDPFWGPGYYTPYYYRPFHHPGFYGPGFWGPSWRVGFGGYYGYPYGYGYGAYSPYMYGGGGWYNPYYSYGNRYNHFRDNVVYNTGRRGELSSYNSRSNSSALRNASDLESRSRTSSYSRSIRNLRGSNDDYGITRRTVDRNYEPRRNTTYSRTNYPTTRRSTSSDSYSRSQVPTRNSNTVRTPTSTSRSSGTVRSSSSGSSSSGRSSSGTSRGRGNN